MQDQQLLDGRLVGEGHLADAGQVGQQDRQRGLQPLEQLAGLVGGRAAVAQDPGNGGVAGRSCW